MSLGTEFPFRIQSPLLTSLLVPVTWQHSALPAHSLPDLIGFLLSICPHILSLWSMFPSTFSHSTVLSPSVPGQCCLNAPSARYCSQWELSLAATGKKQVSVAGARVRGGSRGQTTQHLRPGATQRARGRSQRVGRVKQVPASVKGGTIPTAGCAWCAHGQSRSAQGLFQSRADGTCLWIGCQT